MNHARLKWKVLSYGATAPGLIRADDIEALQRRLPGLKVVCRFTRDPDDPEAGRIDRPLLQQKLVPKNKSRCYFYAARATLSNRCEIT